MASTASLSPCTTLSTPSGKPASLNSSQTSIGADGSRSDGFRMKVLPQAIATGYIHIGTMAGKLNGVMPATDAERLAVGIACRSPARHCARTRPSGDAGCRRRTPPPRCRAPPRPAHRHASCRARCEMARAMSAACLSSSSLNLNMKRARFSGGVRPQAGRAAFAACDGARRLRPRVESAKLGRSARRSPG